MSCWLPSPDSKLFIRFLELLNSFIWSCFTCMFRRCKMCLRSPPISDILELCNVECLSGAVVPCDLHNETVVEIDMHQLFELDYHWGFQQHDRTRTPYHKYPKKPERVDAGLKWLHYFLLRQKVTSLISASSEFGGMSNRDTELCEAVIPGRERDESDLPVRKFCDMREVDIIKTQFCNLTHVSVTIFLRGILTWMWIKLFFTLFALSAGGVSPRLEQKKT